MAAGRTRRALKRCLCSALPMASVARGTGARRAAPRSRSSGTDSLPMSPLPRWLFLGFNALRQRGTRLASPPSPCPHNRGGCGSAGGRCWRWLEEEQGMGSLCPRPIFCFPWFVQKNRKDWGFFFLGCAALGTNGVRSGVSSLSFPTVGRGQWHRARGDLGGRDRLWGSLLPLLQHFVASPSSSIAAHCSASSTSSLKHFPFHFYFMERLQICFFPPAKPPDP